MADRHLLRSQLIVGCVSCMVRFAGIESKGSAWRFCCTIGKARAKPLWSSHHRSRL